MHWKRPGQPVGRRTLAAVALTACIAGLVVTGSGSAGAKPTPPPNPTDTQISGARDAKQAMADLVGKLSGEIAQAKVELQQLQARAELEEQRYAYAESRLQLATEAAARAERAVHTAQRNVDDAHARFVEYVQATYMSGSVDGTAGTLLTADDPSALLEQSALENYQQQHQVDAIGALETATVAKSNAEARARAAVNARAKAADQAQQRRDAARSAYESEQEQKAALTDAMQQRQVELQAAQEKLASLNHQRAQFVAWQAEQRRLARIRAQKRREEQRRQEEAARRALENSGGGGGGSVSGGGSSGPPPPSGGNWTANKGRQAARRALSQVGWPYAWAGGGAYGPSRGVCDPSNGAPNDCMVIGYDCSGLAMYAWGAGWWAHYAASQYTQAGSYHPDATSLLPGDLIFWSSNGHISGIHHVAVYIGGGQIVEAPYSGGFVQVASVYEYGGFFGATRPLT